MRVEQQPPCGAAVAAAGCGVEQQQQLSGVEQQQCNK